MRLARQRLGLLLAVLAVLVALLPSAAPGAGVRAATSSLTLETSVQVSFPASLTFKVKVQGDSDVARLRLLYRVERQNYARVVSEAWPEFTPGRTVVTQWVWDMRKGGLPPGAVVEYWWTGRDSSGGRWSSEPARVVFEDNRYPWQSVNSGAVTILWYQGDQAFVDELMSAARSALQRLADDTGVFPARNVKLYVYGSTEQLRSALLFPQEWTGGVTFGGFDVIAIGIPQAALDWGRRAVAHELSHWVVGQLTFNNYGAGLPVWLEEGLATWAEGEMTSDTKAWLDKAVLEDKVISVRSLSSPFSAVPEEAFISYAESRSIVDFLIRTYGKDKMLQLLHVFRDGSAYDEALRRVYGFDQDGLDALWRPTLKPSVTGPLSAEPALA